jgi:hypothetical protein
MIREEFKFVMHGFAGERQELDTVLQAGIFAPSSNAAKLLRYICERHFEKPAEPVGEYEVAVHALGRRANFDSQKDSIVRVEAHRVRRRLMEYYETDGAAHAVRIELPRGQYKPHFTPLSESADAPAPVEPISETETTTSTAARRRSFVWPVVALAAVGLAAVAVGKLELSRRDEGSRRAVTKPVASIAISASDSIHILAGRTSGLYSDQMGTRWSSDAWYTGGNAERVRYYSLALADDPAIYGSCRTGKDFSYDIPLQPGHYEMRLMFAESSERVPIMGEVGDGARSIKVLANGVQILPPRDGRHRQALDITADAGGVDTADVKVFKDISPAADGKLHLRFFGSKGEALVNGIEIVPGLTGRMRPLRWRAGDAPYADQAGNLWLADHYFRGGRSSRFHNEVSGTKEPGLYQGERFGSFTYSVPVVSAASYTVTIHFAENYFGLWSKPLSPPRMFNVYANFSPLLRDFDITKAAGGPARAVTRTFRDIRPNSFDKINLCFEPVTEFAVVNAIEVEDQSR